MTRLAGKICLVTGGGTGIGRATAELMAREGAAGLVIAGRRRPEGEAAAKACRDHGCATIFIPTDVTQDAEVQALIAATTARFGRLDVAFNNAGAQERRAPLHEQPETVFDHILAANLKSVFLCLRHQIPAMAPGAAIVVNASVSGLRNPNPGLALYSASKAAVISLVRSAAMECAPHGIRINAVAPGRVSTDMMRASGIADPAAVAASLPLRRMGHPTEVAEAVVWLASDAASFIVGHTLAADGGFLAT